MCPNPIFEIIFCFKNKKTNLLVFSQQQINLNGHGQILIEFFFVGSRVQLFLEFSDSVADGILMAEELLRRFQRIALGQNVFHRRM